MSASFRFACTPQIIFGAGAVSQLDAVVVKHNGPVLAIAGLSALESPAWDRFQAAARNRGCRVYHERLTGEPSPEFVDQTVETHRHNGIALVIGWGGGSAVDAGKAVSAMLPREGSVADYLEDVGSRTLVDGRKIPYLAIPTTAGTGSETTKNAVLSVIAANGYKKSLRHDNFIPDFAIVDPELALTCPRRVTAACGMDALTQLIEGYVSPAASPMTDALALSGLERAAVSLERAVFNGETDIEARSGMAYAALVSGIVLANAGLGIVHGLASPIGGYYPVPHGIACGTLIAAATQANIRKLQASGSAGQPALRKYARVGALLAGDRALDCAADCQFLIDKLWQFTRDLEIPSLSQFGIDECDVTKILDGTSNKNNPIVLERTEIGQLLCSRL